MQSRWELLLFGPLSTSGNTTHDDNSHSCNTIRTCHQVPAAGRRQESQEHHAHCNTAVPFAHCMLLLCGASSAVLQSHRAMYEYHNKQLRMHLSSTCRLAECCHDIGVKSCAHIRWLTHKHQQCSATEASVPSACSHTSHMHACH